MAPKTLNIEVNSKSKTFILSKNLYGIFGKMKISKKTILFLIFCLFRTKYIFTVQG